MHDRALRARWNAAAVEHAESVPDGRADELMASLYLNLADAHLAAGDVEACTKALHAAGMNVRKLPAGGYRTFVERGIIGLQQRLMNP